jgi:putative protease
VSFRLPVQPAKYVLPLNRENVEEGIRFFKKYHKIIVWSFPPIIMEENLNWYSQAVASLVQKDYQEFQLGHFSQSSMFDGFADDLQPINFFGDYTTNILNNLSLEEMRELGFAGAQFSIETDGDNLAAALSDFGHPPQRGKAGKAFLVGMYVYGRPPLFTARLDNAAFNYGKRFVSPRGEEFVLSRKNDMTIARSIIPFDLLDMSKKLERIGVNYLLVDLSEGSMKRNVSEFITHYSQKGRRPVRMEGNFSEILA